MPHYDAYIICTSPRSGSTLLCSLLAATSAAGNPASYFHRPSVSSWLNHFKLSPDPATPERTVLGYVVEAAIAEGSLETGMFGLRLQAHSAGFFSRKLAILHPGLSSDRHRLEMAFGRTAILYLSRLDKVEQAVSYVKAEQTGLWHRAADGSELERLSPPQPPVYNADKISASVEELTRYDQQWERWFAQENLDPLRITYEALADHPTSVMAEILEHLGLDSEVASDVEPGVARLANSVSREWIARYRAETHTVSI